MSKIAVVYRSRYGHAETYAKWIADALGADLLEGGNRFNPRRLDRYDTLVFGGGLYAGGIGGSKLLTANFDRWKAKRLVVFTVGLTSTEDPAYFAPIVDRVFPLEMQERIRFFHLRGGIDYARLGFFHRTVMGAMRTALKRKPDRSPQDDMILEAFGGRVDFRDKKSVAPLVEYVRGLEGAAP